MASSNLLREKTTSDLNVMLLPQSRGGTTSSIGTRAGAFRPIDPLGQFPPRPRAVLAIFFVPSSGRAPRNPDRGTCTERAVVNVLEYWVAGGNQTRGAAVLALVADPGTLLSNFSRLLHDQEEASARVPQ